MATLNRDAYPEQARNCALASGEQVTIEKAGVGDLFGIANLQRACFESAQAYGVITLLMFQFWPRSYMLVARIGERIAGCVIGDIQRDQARILNVCVDPRIRRRGLGSHLLSSMESLLDHDNLTLMVEDKNVPAQELYRRHGFMQSGDLRDYYGRNRHGFLMQKRRAHPAIGYRPTLIVSDRHDEDASRKTSPHTRRF